MKYAADSGSFIALSVRNFKESRIFKTEFQPLRSRQIVQNGLSDPFRPKWAHSNGHAVGTSEVRIFSTT